MLNKNGNCYNIEKILNKHCASAFSEHITIFRTPSIDIWQLKCQLRQTNKAKYGILFPANFSELSNFSSSSFWGKPLGNQIGVPETFSNLELFFIFSETFLELIFTTKIKTMLLKQSAVLFTSCQKNIAYIMCLKV